jgi:hypothetical protein
MKNIFLIALLLLLAGCGITGGPVRLDRRAIEQCAELHPPPPQAKVNTLGLIPVYLTRSAASDDEATKQWFGAMDSCTAQYKPPEKAK